ncbi:MAG: hypothetical protein KC897_05810 [Candidatus Omnitrophica bacterium]|nr:hypothetical protein [Candidatus Omnitrophota bacterium]MCB9720954.1 hypothetical protein [Candidatus Omnitrophota bacterium]
MYRRRKDKWENFKVWFTLIIVVILAVLIFASKWVENAINKLMQRAIAYPKIHQLEEQNRRNLSRIYQGKVVRRILMNPNRTHAESRIYNDGELVAQFSTIKGDEIENLKGVLPEGQIGFINETKETYGQERYRKGKRHGEYAEYYSNGVLYRRAKFYEGKLMENEIFYFDGTPRRIEDFKDALRFVDDPEVGYGRIYYRDGSLMYEWKLTNLLKGGYKKSYNKEGRLVEEKVYDNMGDLVEVIKPGRP